jgi:ribonuclease J
MARLDELEQLPPERVVIVTTGSQGEPTSALVRMANKSHREVAIQPGDTVVISATPIPGNETLVHKTINNLIRQGATVLYDKVERVHVHGHAAQEELKTMISLIKPKHFVPIHGEYRHLAIHAAIAQSLGVAKDNVFIMEDGDVLEIEEGVAGLGDRVQAGPIYVDGLARWDMSTTVLRDRKNLSKDGFVVAFLAVDKRTGAVVGTPELISYGFLDDQEEEEVLPRGRELVIEALTSGNGHRSDLGSVHTAVKEALSEYFFQATKRRPMIFPVAIEV